MTATINLENHPCFNVKVKGQFGRVHLPVAPKCNIQCNYCNRKYDCVNESRPGVTSTILSPAQAAVYMEKVLEKEPRISVAGIAGPGDPFANPEETLGTMRLLREKFPDLILCLATNGLNLKPEYIDEIAEIGVSHVTVTINAIDPEITRKVYRWVRHEKSVYQGLKGAKLLLERQLEAVKGLKAAGITVKINCIVMPGINDHHVVEVAKAMAELGADLFNAMAMYPTAETPFEGLTEPDAIMMAKIRKECEEYLPQMRHCTRCRADAVGLLGADQSEEFHGCLIACSKKVIPIEEKERPYVAVATVEGILVNQHLGQVDQFQIWQKTDQGFTLVEERLAPDRGSGFERWQKVANMLKDCRAILASSIGDNPKEILTKCGVLPVEMSGFIETGLQAVYEGSDLSKLKGKRQVAAGKVGECTGSGLGCG
ncbi:nitrogenase cofactor biosynthesis protein NifB [Coleofasciculus chthonoplastes PCC 7420]|uniref:FeMo cofactor biosynthesis protein NifB n=1 Tax=Coleofasciculus chthonoplastes PCC 7420 TaxID=118168 RepID=B4VJN9_9CYAN|nr:nitrogenase cofactor biosynthesis protein NifB [Coleofasciculus chthonoplastes]EDX77648.1 nitrogenase cofactor biosynthesis protein NifB [Coleofasciculus chthonoplastes PCC 7420]